MRIRTLKLQGTFQVALSPGCTLGSPAGHLKEEIERKARLLPSAAPEDADSVRLDGA